VYSNVKNMAQLPDPHGLDGQFQAHQGLAGTCSDQHEVAGGQSGRQFSGGRRRRQFSRKQAPAVEALPGGNPVKRLVQGIFPSRDKRLAWRFR
jgi:hypothetical protein